MESIEQTSVFQESRYANYYNGARVGNVGNDAGVGNDVRVANDASVVQAELGKNGAFSLYLSLELSFKLKA